jgi:hypothetical protein
VPITVSTLLIMANRLNPGKKHRGCCFGWGITMLAVFIGSWALPILAKMKSDRAIEKLRALSAVQADDSDMEFVTEGDKLELQMPEQYGKMYYSQPSPAHFTVAETGEAYVDNEIIAVAESGTSRSVIDSLAEQSGAEIVGEITIADTYQMRLQRSVSYEEIDFSDNARKIAISIFLTFVEYSLASEFLVEDLTFANVDAIFLYSLCRIGNSEYSLFFVSNFSI